jgi:hypothetical protein
MMNPSRAFTWAGPRDSASTTIQDELRNAYLAMLAPLLIVGLIVFFVWLNAR